MIYKPLEESESWHAAPAQLASAKLWFARPGETLAQVLLIFSLAVMICILRSSQKC